MKASAIIAGAFLLPILKESDLGGYLFRAVQIQGQASKSDVGQQLRLFLRRNNLWQSSNGTLRYADDRRVFLRPYLIGSGGGTATTPL